MNFHIQVAAIESGKIKIPVIFYYDETGKIRISLMSGGYSDRQNYIMDVLVPNLQKITFDNMPQTAFTLATSGFSCKEILNRYGTITGIDLNAHPVNLAETMNQLLAFFGENIILPKSDSIKHVERAGDLLSSDHWITEKIDSRDTHLKRIAEITDKNATIFESNVATISKSLRAKNKHTL